MNLNKNAKTYLIKYIKTQNPNNQQEKQTTKHKESLSYRINKYINIRKTTISSRREQQTVLYTNKKRTQLKTKGTYKKILKDKNINNCLNKYI